MTPARSIEALLEKATRARGMKMGAFQLWRLVDEATESPAERQSVYRHAMIHGGLIPAGRPLACCPICEKALA